MEDARGGGRGGPGAKRVRVQEQEQEQEQGPGVESEAGAERPPTQLLDLPDALIERVFEACQGQDRRREEAGGRVGRGRGVSFGALRACSRELLRLSHAAIEGLTLVLTPENVRYVGALARSTCGHLKRLSLSWVGIEPAAAPNTLGAGVALRAFTQLEQLALRVPKRQVASLLGGLAHPRLTVLDLSNSRIDDAAAAALAGALAANPMLTDLNLSGNAIGCGGTAALAGAFMTAGAALALTVLDLEGNEVGNEGAAALGAAAAAGSMRSLTTLDLSFNSIQDEGLSALGAGIKTAGTTMALTSLNLSGNLVCAIGDDAAGAALAVILKATPKLRCLAFSGNQLADAGAVALATALPHAELRTLDLGSNCIGDEGANALGAAFEAGGAPELRDLDLRKNLLGYLALARALKARALPKLRYLNLSGNGVDCEDLEEVADALVAVPKLEELGLSMLFHGNKVMRLEAVLRVLAAGTLPALTSLDIGCNTRLSAASDKALTGALASGALASLTSLDLCGTCIKDTALVRALGAGALARLRVLNLSNTLLGKGGGTALAEVVAGGAWPQLRRLFVSGCQLCHAIAPMAEALESGTMPHLTHIDLSMNLDLESGRGFDEAGAAALMAALVAIVTDALSSLEYMDIGANRLSEDATGELRRECRTRGVTCICDFHP